MWSSQNQTQMAKVAIKGRQHCCKFVKRRFYLSIKLQAVYCLISGQNYLNTCSISTQSSQFHNKALQNSLWKHIVQLIGLAYRCPCIYELTSTMAKERTRRHRDCGTQPATAKSYAAWWSAAHKFWAPLSCFTITKKEHSCKNSGCPKDTRVLKASSCPS